MHPEEIKAGLRMKGHTQAMLADEMEVARSSINDVIKGYKKSARIQARISAILGKPVATIWPPAADRPMLRRTRKSIQVAA